MSLIPPGSYRKTRGILRRDTRVNQPAASDVLEGTFYYVTDELKLERSNGATWDDCSTTGATLPIDLASQVTGILPTANGGTNVDIASAALLLGSGQITFPAIQNISANVNTLDDYERGDWTVVDNSGAGLSIVNGTTAKYIKIGKLVVCSGDITYPATASGLQAILSLPFAALAGGLNWSGNLGYATMGYGVYIHGSGSNWYLWNFPGAPLTNTDMSAQRVIFSFSYVANS